MKKDGLDGYSKEIVDRVLAGLNDWALGKMWQVVSALNSEMMLRGTDTFKIPCDKFELPKTP